MNLATFRVFGCIKEGDFDRVHKIISDYGFKIGDDESGRFWYGLGDDVLCARLRTQNKMREGETL